MRTAPMREAGRAAVGITTASGASAPAMALSEEKLAKLPFAIACQFDI
jgi:hypothetical protein